MRCLRWICLSVIGSLSLVAGVGGAAPPRPNNNAYQQQLQQYQQFLNAFRQAQYRSALAQMNQARNAARMMNAYSRALANNNMYGNQGATGSFTDYICVPAEEVTVRRYRLPTKDENGQPKKYSTEELKELKGDDPKLIGYTASYDDLKIGQTVRVTLARKRTDPKDSDKVTYVTINTFTGTLQKMDENSLKQFTVRVRGTTTPTNAPPGQPRQRGNNNNVREVQPDPDKFATLIVIYSDDAPAAMAGKN